MEIVKLTVLNEELKALESMQQSEQEWVRMRLEKPYSEYSEIKQRQFCHVTISNSYNYNGQTATTDMITHQTGELFNEIKGKFASLTLSEIQSAFKNGLNGVYGPFFGLCGKTYHFFLKSLYSNENRQKSWLAYFEKI